MDPHRRIPVESLSRIVAGAVAKTGDPAFGLQVAMHMHPAHLGPMGHAWLASSSLKEAFGRFVTGAHTVMEFSYVELEERHDRVTVTIRFGYEAVNETAREDTTLGFVVQLCRANAGLKFSPRNVLFQHARPESLEPYRDFFRCPIAFDAAQSSVVFASEDVYRPLPSADPRIAGIVERIIERQLAELKKENFPGQVQSAITDQLASGQASDTSVALALNMTAPTMHRRLKHERTSFNKIFSDTRKDLSFMYLRDHTLSLTQIAYMLGFSQPSSFSRAFRKWTGKSPSEIRRSG